MLSTHKKNRNTRIILDSESKSKAFLSLLLGQLSERAKHFKSPRNPKRIKWGFLKITTTLYNNMSILIC